MNEREGNLNAALLIEEESKLDLDNPNYYLNREISWLQVNERILEEAEDENHPLLERLKFLAICGSNLDEFFMVRVSGLHKQIERGALKLPPDGATPQEQLDMITVKVKELQTRYSKLWNDILRPELYEEGICIRNLEDLNEKQRQSLRKYFEYQIFPTLTPLAVDVSHPFPFISNLSLNLAVVLRDSNGEEKMARVKMPRETFPRINQLMLEEYEDEFHNGENRRISLIFLEDLIASNIDRLFPGLEVVAAYPFRVTRDAEIEITLDQASDLRTAIEQSIETRRVGKPIRLQVDSSMPGHLRDLFMKNFGLNESLVYQFNGPLGLVDFWQFLRLDRPDLKDKPFLPYVPDQLKDSSNLFNAISAKDWLLYHPYDDFDIIVRLLREAAIDPDVLAIKLTMYRIDKQSPIIDALLEARQNKKNVTVLVELKAKFDEENNINWAKKLEQAGVHVVYGFMDLKVHAKIGLIVRKEGDNIKRYSHISSGNYNQTTSRIYADIGYLTANPDIGVEINDLFNFLTGYSEKEDYRTLLVAPKSLRKEVIKRIEREIEHHKETGDGYIAIKLNNLLEKKVIKTLYKASMTGVKIDLNVRALCGLRPGLTGVSDNINQISTVDRFLEHSRIYYFRNGGDEEVLIGSSDLMPRNLDHRVEVLFPIPDKAIRRSVIDNILKTSLRDTIKARVLNSDGEYERIQSDDVSFHSQEWLLKHKGVWHTKHN